LDPGWIDHVLVKQIVMQRLTAHREQTWVSLAAFLAQCASSQIQALVTEATTTERPVPNPAQQLRDVTVRLRNQFITRQMNVLLRQLSQPELTDPRRLELLQQQQDLRLLKNRPLEA